MVLIEKNFFNKGAFVVENVSKYSKKTDEDVWYMRFFRAETTEHGRGHFFIIM